MIRRNIIPKRITIVSGNQITDTPRVVKEADALAEMGHKVTVLGAVWSADALPRIERLLAKRPWRHLPVVDLSDRGADNFARMTALRAASRASRLALRGLRLEHPLQLGFSVLPLWKAARDTPTDLYSLHCEKALWVGMHLNALGRPFFLDMEDWHSQDGLPSDRAMLPVVMIQRSEGFLLNAAVKSTTTSKALAQTLAERYGCPLPAVIYNSFPIAERDNIDGIRKDRRDDRGPSIIWFSQTIGPGRGLETLIAAFQALPETAMLHLRGSTRSGYIDALLSPLPAAARSRIFIHPQVPQNELLSRLAEHDIGYCGELSDCLSRELTITNKALEYMRARLAIVATDTAGQLEIAAAAPGAIRIFRQGDEASLLQALRPLFERPAELEQARQAAVDALTQHFSWEQSKLLLQRQVATYFGEKAGREV
jgi:glycosyltransferase involved in cell wall biosynthesis